MQILQMKFISIWKLEKIKNSISIIQKWNNLHDKIVELSMKDGIILPFDVTEDISE